MAKYKVSPELCTHETPEHWSTHLQLNCMSGDLEDVWIQDGRVSTFEDISIGRLRCTQCGAVKYYSGTWRAYYEDGAPCYGSEGVSRLLPTTI